MRIEGGDPQLADAVARHRPALEAGEARHNLILGLFEHTKQLKPEEYRFWSFARPGSCAFHMGVRNIVLGELAAEDHEALAGSMDGLDWQGIVGPEESAAGLARRFEKRGRAFAPPLAHGIHELKDGPRHPGADGFARAAGPEDRDIFRAFMLAFLKEALPSDPMPPEERIAAELAKESYLLWTVDGKPVSMAGKVRGTATLGCIGGVYTPPDERGKGYAGSVTAALCERLFAAGKRSVCLYTDLANPYSNRCYAKIGFRQVCRASHYYLGKSP